MERGIEELASGKTPGGVQLQSIEDFMKEGDEREADLLSNKPSSKLQPPAKKQKRVIDIEALTAEANALKELGDVNWVGKLNEYRSAHPLTEGLTYTENVAIDGTPRFNYTVTVRESPSPFGGGTVLFGSKKSAKHYASKKAVDWLIENGFMPADGSVKFPKVPQPQPTNSNPSWTSVEDKPKSYVSQVPGLCTKLGFDVPKYEITKVQEGVSLWDGYAHFMGDPRISGRIGQVNNIFGQKKAKEMIAEELVSFLQDIHRQRQEYVEVEKKRKRSSAGLVHQDLAAQAADTERDGMPQAAESFN